MIIVQTARPHPRLVPFVRLYVHRQTHQDGTEVVEPVVARLGTMLEFQFAMPYEIPVCGTDKYLVCPRIAVIGPITHRRVQLVIRDHVESLAILFSPTGFHAIFGIPMSPFSDLGVEGDGVLGPEVTALNERLGNAKSFFERTELLDNFLINQLRRRPMLDIIGVAFEDLIATGLPATVAQLARQTGLSLRQLERRTLEAAGVSPKMLTRIARFQKALEMKAHRDLSWTNVAHAANYHDQMHMVRDFHVFAGDSPSRALAQISPDHLISL